MKRAGEETDRPSKRQKHDPFFSDSTAIFKDPAHEKNATNYVDWADESGYLSGKVHMKWPEVASKYRIVMETSSLASGAKQFEVNFTDRCAEEFRRKGLQFKVAQKMHLSLRGVRCVQKKQGNSTGKTIPVVLHYDEGVALEILPSGQEPGCKIDTWFSEFLVRYPR